MKFKFIQAPCILSSIFTDGQNMRYVYVHVSPKKQEALGQI